jgi:S-DNA-T family DNA segregation ATPase FtsK/SpoIIIE
MFASLNTLIAGVIGSGKSFVEKLILDALLADGDNQFILIDPKKVELYPYKDRIGVLQYADDDESIYEALCFAYELMQTRFDDMRARGLTATDAPQVFVLVDEMAFIMQGKRKKEYVQMLNQITLLGRAAGIHLILCTQVSTQDVIPACIRDNMPNIICLRQRDAGKYRYLLGEFPGRLPNIGKAYVLTPNMEKVEKMDVASAWNRITRR